MNRLLWIIISALLPVCAFAQQDVAGSTLSFAPPPSDFSIVFLGNIFGIVDGVLHGTGSQIMGTMFGVFNSAVLALGGIIIMYTLMVSTMNTAHEGQMLGQKWSSIWVPMRSTLGLALLIPKASGYCLMQIFVMWVTVQGVGAADKVWEAALSYLNRGGTIVQTQVNPLKGVIGGEGTVTTGAAYILSAQVCMAGLQQILEQQREGYMQLKANNAPPCTTPDASMKGICENTVPNFINSVDIVGTQTGGSQATYVTYSVNLPNLPASNPYSALNGICGKLTWNSLEGKVDDANSLIHALSKKDLDAAKLTRAMALQQMYNDLSTVAQIMIKNSPALKSSFMALSSPGEDFSSVAEQQFGIPLEAGGQVCQKSSANCIGWGPVESGTTQLATLFNGTEFQGAISDYNAIMAPTLTYIAQKKQETVAANQRKFIKDADAQGWMMAGSYFFDLARLSSTNQATDITTDSNTGLPADFTMGVIGNACQSSSNSADKPSDLYSPTLCAWMQNDNRMTAALASLIDARDLPGGQIKFDTLIPSVVNSDSNTAVDGVRSSSVFGFIRNGLVIRLPGQPGIEAPAFHTNFNLDMGNASFFFPPKQFGCKGFMCLASIFADLFYNILFVGIWNFLMNLIAGLINTIVFAFILGPLEGMAQIFLHGISYLQQSTANPVVTLAVMGTNYINFSGDLWMYLLTLAMGAAMVPILGFVVFSMLALVMPLLLAWMGVMVSIGFITAYYIPIMPYMIFIFGVMAWLISVIEAMVAAPIVAVGVTHPEGHEAFGKGEHAVMILMNVFLRPAMMVIGYIAAIALSYVAVWMINTGFGHAVDFIQGINGSGGMSANSVLNPFQGAFGGWGSGKHLTDVSKQIADSVNSNAGYTGWAGVYGFFFVILMYTTMYLTVVQKSFTLVTYLPDKILRWIGGQPEGIGQETAQWGEESKGKVEKGGSDTARAKGQMDQQLKGHVGGAMDKMLKPKEGGSIETKQG